MLLNQNLYRRAEGLRLRAAGAADPAEPIRFEAILTTEEPCLRKPGAGLPYYEVLPMRFVDLSRIGPVALPMFYHHNKADQQIGTWANVRVKGKELIGDGELSRTTGTVTSKAIEEDDVPATQPIEALREGVRTRTVRGVSLGYSILAGKRVAAGDTFEGFQSPDGRDLVVALQWQPFEGSILSLPMDPRSYIRAFGRSDWQDRKVEAWDPTEPTAAMRAAADRKVRMLMG